MEDDFLFCTYCGYTEKNNIVDLAHNNTDKPKKEENNDAQQPQTVHHYVSEKDAGRNAPAAVKKRIKPPVIIAAAAGAVVVCIAAVCIISAVNNSSEQPIRTASSTPYTSIPDASIEIKPASSVPDTSVSEASVQAQLSLSESQSSVQESSESSKPSEVSEPQTEQDDNGYNTIEEYIDLVNEGIPENDTFWINVYKDGNYLVYEYKLKTQYGEQEINTLISNLDSAESSNEPLFRSVIDEMREYTGKTYFVKRIYLNSDGSFIRSVEYT